MGNKITVDEVRGHFRHQGLLHYLNLCVVAHIVVWLAKYSLIPAHFTAASLLFALVASLGIISGSQYVAVLFLWLSITFDNIDGIWARTMDQCSRTGRFLDGLSDYAKDYIIDISIFYYYYSNNKFENIASWHLLLLVSIYFSFKGLCYLARRLEIELVGKKTSLPHKKIFVYAGMEKYFFIYPLSIFSYHMFLLFVFVYFLYYLSKFTSVWLKLCQGDVAFRLDS